MTTLTEFLLARLAEDGAVAARANDYDLGPGYSLMTSGRLMVDPARVLAEVEAKRRIVEVAMPGERDDAGERGRILRILAAVHANHPDYRDEWTP